MCDTCGAPIACFVFELTVTAKAAGELSWWRFSLCLWLLKNRSVGTKVTATTGQVKTAQHKLTGPLITALPLLIAAQQKPVSFLALYSTKHLAIYHKSFPVRLEQDARIVPAKAEGIRQTDLDIELLLLGSHNQAQVDFLLGVGQVHVGMQFACTQLKLILDPLQAFSTTCQTH